VIGALYYFSILEGQKMRCRYVDLGGTRPFLTDGLTKYKLGLGAEFVPILSPLKEYIWFGVNEKSEAAMEFLSKNPFMYVNKEFRLVKYEIKN
jgi:lipid II:glycine glycyltransferase (peptidoglycan interpeptide bridge formation enzyme)